MNWKEWKDFELKPLSAFSIYPLLVYSAMIVGIIISMHDYSNDYQYTCALLKDSIAREFAFKQIDIFVIRANSYAGIILLMSGAVLPRGLKNLQRSRITILHSGTLLLLASGIAITLITWFRIHITIDDMLSAQIFSQKIFSSIEKRFIYSLIITGYSALFLLTTPLNSTTMTTP